MKPADVDALVRHRAALLARSAQTRAAAAELITVSKQLTNRTASLLDHMTRTFANVHPTMMAAQARRMPSGPVLWFDAATLSQVRQMVLTQAAAAGLPEHSATDVLMAVHELAANAVRHGGGTGRLRVSVTPGHVVLPDRRLRPSQLARPNQYRAGNHLGQDQQQDTQLALPDRSRPVDGTKASQPDKRGIWASWLTGNS
jgi:histidine kinase-like protein